MLTVRGRVRADLEALRNRYLPGMSEIVAGAGTDYKYRAQVPRAALAKALQQIVLDIDYSNFKNEVAHEQGAERSHLYHEVWDVLYKLQDAPAALPSVTRQQPKPQADVRLSFGGVLVDDEGRMLLREPRGHFDGYVWTFAKGLPRGSETAEQAALREVLEETGYQAQVIGEIPGEFAGSTGVNRYFLMRPSGPGGKWDRETQNVCWVTPDEARVMIEKTTNMRGRKRDLAVLDAAVKLWRERRK
jgi:8-oxo-dGTP pyrophosphatase MutT (NUDIX family)